MHLFPAMEAKKVAFSEQFFSYRRKVVSGFGLGVVASLVIFSLLFYCNDFKPPVGKSSVDSLFISWPFSFSSAPVFTSPTGNGSAPASDSENLDNTMHSGIHNESNGSTISTIEQTLLKNQTHEYESKNGSSNAQIPSLQAKPSEVEFRNGSSMGESGRNNGSFSLSSNYKWNEEVSKGVESVNEPKCLNCTYRENQKGQNSSEEGGISDEKINYELTEIDSNSDQKCDLFDGRWVRDDTKPYYPAGSCPLIDRDFDCHLNKRPDEGYVKWKWQPNGCDIPSLNATDFLERLRGKKVVFVGDSLNRNMWESLVCILRHSISDKNRVYEISGRTEFKKKGFYAFRFEDYNCSVDFVSSPFLVRESSFNGKNGSSETLRLDLMDRTTLMYNDADVLIFNTGHWWTHEKTSRGEDYYQEGEYVHPRLKVLEAYKRALTTWGRWIDKNINPNRTIIFFRGYSLTHFRGGLWNSGGQCHKETDPIFNESQVFKYPTKMRALEYVFKEMKTPVIYLNISRQTGYRKDGHPSIYRMEYQTEEEKIAAEQSQDCSHWCLPGVPDTWNELLYASLLKVRHGRLWGN